MCTVKELKDYLATIPDGVEVFVLQEVTRYMDGRTWAAEKELSTDNPKLVEYNAAHNYLLLGGYA